MQIWHPGGKLKGLRADGLPFVAPSAVTRDRMFEVKRAQPARVGPGLAVPGQEKRMSKSNTGAATHFV